MQDPLTMSMKEHQFVESKLRPLKLATGDLATEQKIQDEKAEEFLKLEQDLGELNSTYREFTNLVKEQGAGLNTIQSNTNQAVVRVEKGVEELKHAGELQKSSRKKMCCLLMIIMVIVGIVVVVVVVIKS